MLRLTRQYITSPTQGNSKSIPIGDTDYQFITMQDDEIGDKAKGGQRQDTDNMGSVLAVENFKTTKTNSSYSQPTATPTTSLPPLGTRLSLVVILYCQNAKKSILSS